MARKKMMIKELAAGMKLVEDVLSQEGLLLVASGTVITPRIIARLTFYSIPYVYVEYTVVEQPKESSFYKQIESTNEFKRFNYTLKSGVQILQKAINQALLYNEEIDTSSLLEGVERIAGNAGNGMHLISMLQCIRKYDDLVYVHSINVSLICNVMGEWLHLPQQDIKVLTIAGLLHDIGKAIIPQEILCKASKLTDQEFELIKKHPMKGYELIKDSKLDQRVKLAILQHHERCDGTGYPFGDRGINITDFAKIVAIADVYDAMTSNRVYRQGICPFDVIDTFEKEGYQKYDPKFLIPFLQRISQCYINAKVKLSNGQQGEVIMLNNTHLSRPVVKVGGEYLNLAEKPSITISSLI